jgi:hypothetical protein
MLYPCWQASKMYFPSALSMIVRKRTTAPFRKATDFVPNRPVLRLSDIQSQLAQSSRTKHHHVLASMTSFWCKSHMQRHMEQDTDKEDSMYVAGKFTDRQRKKPERGTTAKIPAQKDILVRKTCQVPTYPSKTCQTPPVVVQTRYHL